MKVFLSHSFEDDYIVKKVRNYLVHNGIGVFDDKKDIETGASLFSSINNAINNSDAVLFFISKKSEKSHWAAQEMSLAVSNKFKGKDLKLIPILIDKHTEPPFFLKDYAYLDMSKSLDFDVSMKKLLSGLSQKKEITYKQELAEKYSSIEFEKELLKLKSLEHGEYKKFKTRQMFFVTMITTLISAIAASVGLLSWVAKIDYSSFEWFLAFSVGAIASMIGSVLYMRKEKPHRNEIIQKIKESRGQVHLK